MLDKLKFLVSDVPSYMIFWVTQNCNAACAFCFNFEENLKKNRDLSVEEVRRIADRFRPRSCHALRFGRDRHGAPRRIRLHGGPTVQ